MDALFLAPPLRERIALNEVRAGNQERVRNPEHRREVYREFVFDNDYRFSARYIRDEGALIDVIGRCIAYCEVTLDNGAAHNFDAWTTQNYQQMLYRDASYYAIRVSGTHVHSRDMYVGYNHYRDLEAVQTRMLEIMQSQDNKLDHHPEQRTDRATETTQRQVGVRWGEDGQFTQALKVQIYHQFGRNAQELGREQGPPAAFVDEMGDDNEEPPEPLVRRVHRPAVVPAPRFTVRPTGARASYTRILQRQPQVRVLRPRPHPATLPARRSYVAGYQVKETGISPRETVWIPPKPKFVLAARTKRRREVVDWSTHHRHILGLEKSYVGEEYVGAYELLAENEKMFMKVSTAEVYITKQAVLPNPETKSQSCFLMAFLRSERLKYWFTSHGTTLPQYCIATTSIRSLTGDLSQELCVPVTLQHWEHCVRDFPFYRTATQELVLFNTAKSEQDEEELAYWELAARDLEHQMNLMFPDVVAEGRWDDLLDVNALEEVAQCCADVFRVIINIYSTDLLGKRIWSFQPRQLSMVELVRGNTGEDGYGYLPVVHMLYDRGHMYPIASLHKYLCVDRKTQISKEQWCPFCQDKKHGVWEEDHIQQCFVKYAFAKKLPCYSEQTFREMQMSEGIQPYLPVFTQEFGKVQACAFCRTPCLSDEEWMMHTCYIKHKKLQELLPEECFYCYDIEAAQVPHPHQPNMKYHVCNYLVLRKVYPRNEEEKKGIHFENEYAFMDYLVQAKKEHLVIFAHNGGSYDHHFIRRYMARMQLEYRYIPAPSSKHKFLSLTMVELDITFLDFRYFMPGSLAKIADSLGVVGAKGDFPHQFNRAESLDYVGPVPPLDTEEDFWCLKTKSKVEQVVEIRRFYEELRDRLCTCYDAYQGQSSRLSTCLHCTKPFWNMRREIAFYCANDVEVLCQCVAAYRGMILQLHHDYELNPDIPDVAGQTWKPKLMEPFSCLTLPHLAFTFYLAGFEQCFIQNYIDVQRRGMFPEALAWLDHVSAETGREILHRKNHVREYYDSEAQMFVDGWCPSTKRKYKVLGCDLFGCPHCCAHDIAERTIHPVYTRIGYDEVARWGERVAQRGRRAGIEVQWQCEVRRRLGELSPRDVQKYRTVAAHEYFYGGRTEVFQPYVNRGAFGTNEDIKYIDVCSLYPWVCANCTLPFGTPTYYNAQQCQEQSYRLFHPNANNKFWGYIRCRIRPNRKCLLGLLPSRTEEGRLAFTLHEQDGCWGLEEVELAWKNGYEVVEVYEIIHWDPDQRSNALFRAYVDFFLRLKQESEGWMKLGGSSADPPMEEKRMIQQKLYEENGCIGRIRIEKVKKDDVIRLMAKLFLNSLWGKFAQQIQGSESTNLFGLQQFCSFFHHASVNKETIQIQQLSETIFHATYSLHPEYVRGNPRGHTLLAASVTQHARIRLHTQMLVCGPEKIIYCDTDSLVVRCTLSQFRRWIGLGLGQWTDEYPKETIERFYALAPKLYAIVTGKGLQMKAKGVSMTLWNQGVLQEACVRHLVQYGVVEDHAKGQETVALQNFTISANVHENGLAYGTLVTLNNQKEVRCVISKRQIPPMPASVDWETLSHVPTYPIGYDFS